MRFKNRKGSTLALTIMIFAVLMIFATFTLGFMVTENKQAMYHQNKTQAYYIARSGVEATQKAIQSIALDATEKYNFIMNGIPDSEPSNSNVNLDIDGFDSSKLDIRLFKEYIGTSIIDYNGTDVEASEYKLHIIARGNVNGVEDVASLIIPTKISDVESLLTNAILVYLKDASQELIDLKIGGVNVVVKGDPDQYGPHDKTNGDYIDNMSKRFPLGNDINLVGGQEYYVNGDIDLSGKNINVTGDGTAIIHVKGGLRVYGSSGNKTTLINYFTGSNKDKLHIYVYNKDSTYPYSLQIGEPGNNDKDVFSRAKYYIKDGGVDIHIHKLDFESDIFTNGDIINVTSHSNSNQHIDLVGIILAPNATINLGNGEDNNTKVAINIRGLVVGNEIWYLGKNLDKLGLYTAGIEDDLIPYSEVFITNVGEGYYR